MHAKSTQDIYIKSKHYHDIDSATIKACKVLVFGDSLLRGAKEIVFCPDNFFRDVCCLSGAFISNVTCSTVKPGEPYRISSVLTIPHRIWNNETIIMTTGLGISKKDCMSLGTKLKESGAHILFYSPSQRKQFKKEEKN